MLTLLCKCTKFAENVYLQFWCLFTKMTLAGFCDKICIRTDTLRKCDTAAENM